MAQREWLAWERRRLSGAGTGLGSAKAAQPGRTDGSSLPMSAGKRRLCAAVIAFLAFGAWAVERHYTLPLLLAADNERGQGFVRILNASNVAGTVSIRAFDDAGQAYGPLELAIDADGARHFNSGDLEDGNPAKGITGATGPGTGDWRLELSSRLDLVALAFVRTPDGFLTSMHDAAQGWWDESRGAQGAHVYPLRFFNPASNTRLASEVRVVNIGPQAQRITIQGRDDEAVSSPLVSFRLAANGARFLTAPELETGAAAGLDGGLGDGAGKWELYVSAAAPLKVMSLVKTESGHFTNLSSDPTASAPASMQAFQARTAGKVVRATAGDVEVEFADAGFTQRESGVVTGGAYSYEGVGPRTGFLQWTYADGPTCAASLIFATQAAGRLLSVCSSGTGMDLDWELVERD